MSLQYAHGVVQWLSSDAATTTYTVSGLPFQPKAILFDWIGIQNASNAASESLDENRGEGYAVSTSERRSVGTHSTDGGASADCGMVVSNDCVACTVSNAGSRNGALDITAFNADGFTLTVDDATPASLSVLWSAWGGADITVAAVGDITEPASAGDVDYTVTGFVAGATDQIVFLSASRHTAAINSGQATDSLLSIGRATASANIVVSGVSDDAAATMVTQGHARTGSCLACMAGTPVTSMGAYAVLTQFGTDNFRLNWTLPLPLTGRRAIFLAIKGGHWTVGSYTIDGTTLNATATVSGLAYAPIGVLLMGINNAEAGSATTVFTRDYMSLGRGDASAREAVGVLDEHNTASAEINTLIDYESILAFPSTAGALASSYDLNALNSDGFQIIVDAVGSSTTEWQGYVTFGSLPDPPARNLVQVSSPLRW